MDGNYVEFEGKTYAIDVEKLIQIATKTSDSVKDKTKVETWGYTTDDDGQGDFRVLQKEISESISDGTETFSTIRYDLIKNLLNLIVSPIADDNGNVMRINSFEDMFFGQLLAFNTLINEGIIIEVSED